MQMNDLVLSWRELVVIGMFSAGVEPAEIVRRMKKGQSSEPPQRRPLTVAELMVVGMLAQGKSATEIGRELNRSIKTISTHRVNALEKIGGVTLIDIADFARYVGMVAVPSAKSAAVQKPPLVSVFPTPLGGVTG